MHRLRCTIICTEADLNKVIYITIRPTIVVVGDVDVDWTSRVEWGEFGNEWFWDDVFVWTVCGLWVPFVAIEKVVGEIGDEL